MIRVCFFVLLTIITACSDPVANEQSRWKTYAANTEIIRDDFGVPHIYGKTDADAVFGLLYAQCEDDFNRVERNYISAIGRLAEVEGEEAIYSDLRARMFMTQEEAIAQYNQSPEWLKKLCDAFADGINYFLFTHPEVKPTLITHFEPWMPLYFSEGSIGGDIEGISTRKIAEFYNGSPTTWRGNDRHVEEEATRPMEYEPSGSNGIAVNGSLTASGHAMLLINPHTSFFFRGEVHMVSEEGLNAYGAVTWGQFFVYQGFNERTGWMHTSTYTDRVDEFIESTTRKGDSLFYRYGDELRPVITYEVTLRYKDGNEMKDRKFPLYRTHHGPVTHQLGGKWVTTAMMWEPVKALEQSFMRTKQSNHASFHKMMDIRTNATNNTVYADADGTIAYYHGNFIPVKNQNINYLEPVDGSNPETDWKGIHSVDECITLVNPPNGWIQNCNSTPFTSAGPFSPDPRAYPKYMTADRENFRGVHAIRLLEKTKSLTLDGLIDLAYDPYLPAFEVLIPGLLAAYDQHGNRYPALQEAIGELRKWDFAVSKESVAMSLAHFYGLTCMQNGMSPPGLSEMERIKYFATESPAEERLKLFNETVMHLTEDFGSWQIRWGEINRYQRINGEIVQPFNDSLRSLPIGMASGRWGALASFGARATTTTKRIYGTSGNSFVAVVEFGNRVRAKSMLAGGESGNPRSKHFDDQAQRYADGKFKEVAYYREDVERRAETTYHPGEEKK